MSNGTVPPNDRPYIWIDDTLVTPGLALVPDGLSLADEVLHLRRESSKTFSRGAGRFTLAQALGPVHYKFDLTNKDETWKDVDLTIRQADGRLVVDRAYYNLEIFTDRVGYRYENNTGGWVEVELQEIGDQPVSVAEPKFVYDGNVLFWNNIVPGVDLKLLARPKGVEIYKCLRDASAPKRFLWRIREEKRGCGYSQKSGGRDSDGQALRILNTVTQLSSGQYTHEEVWTGEIGEVVDAKTRQRQWTNAVVWPVIVDAGTTEDITNDADDVYQGYVSAASKWFDAAKFRIGFWPTGTRLYAGARFQSLGIPRGATINSAKLQVKTKKWYNWGANPKAVIYADDVDDAPAWTANDAPVNVTKTATSANFTPGGSYASYSISVTNIVQSIISRGAWTSGNDVRFAFLSVDVGGGNVAYLYDYGDGQVNAAHLVIDYTSLLAGHMTPMTKYWGP